MTETKPIKTSCRFYKGSVPCNYHKKTGVLCWDCKNFKKIGLKELEIRKKAMLTFGNIRIKKNLDNFFKILIIKFGAPGDVLRTTPILESLRKKYRHCYIAWLTWRASLELLENNPMIDKLLSCNNSAKEALTEKYDMLLSFDKDPTAISLATKAKAKKKFGFKIDRFGALNVFNDNSLYALQLGIDNRLKFSGNSKTYQEIIYEMSELKRDYGPYIFNLDERCVLYGRKVLYKFGMKPYHTVIGLNTGAGKIFLTKKWPITYFVQLTKMLAKLKNVKIVLLGGGDERAINKIISSKTKQVAVNLGTHYSKKEFAGIVNNCDIIVTADTLCMHIAIALKKKIIALFGPTAEMEVDLYGSGKKISSRIPCSPCYRLRCHDTKCMKSIKPDSVFKEIKQFISQYDK